MSLTRISYYEDNDIYFHHARDKFYASEIAPIRVHNTYGMYGFIDGSCRYKIEGSEYILKPGCILLIRPSEAYKIYIDNDCNYERVVINFKASILQSIDPNLVLFNAFNERSLGYMNMYKPGEFSINPINYIQAMCPLNISNEERRLAVILNLISILHEIMIIFNKKSNNYNIAEDDMDYKLIQYINENLFNPISLDKISKDLFLSKKHLERKFKKLTGSSIFEYITLKRLTEAQQLLFQGEKASKVSKICGYSDYATFFRAYKKQFGFSPSVKNGNV